MAMRFDTSPAPHVIAGYTVPRVMFQVLLALLPVALVQVAVFGPGLLLQLLVAGPDGTRSARHWRCAPAAAMRRRSCVTAACS